MMNGHTNGAKAHPTAVLTYSVQDVDVLLMDTGEMLIDGHVLSQQQAYAVSVAIKAPGMRALINRIELTRQEMIVCKLMSDDERPR